jgi:hypothetical protein
MSELRRWDTDNRPRGERNGRSKLTWEQVQEIKALLLASTMTQYEIASKFGVCQATISNIWHSKIWTTKEWRI